MTALGAEQEIRWRISRQGRITFAEFMELALYWPEGGYYSNPENIGPHGDFYTAPSAHPAFGALLCLQIYQMWLCCGRPPTFWVVELGAGTGSLCHDLLAYADHLPDEFAGSLRYLCLDRHPYPGSEAGLPGTLKAVDRITCHGVPLSGVVGCVVSNELVDAFPVHRVTVQGGALKEVYVTLVEGRLVEVLDSPSTPDLQLRFDSLGIALEEGASGEINLALESWIHQIASALDRGFVITIDYGGSAEQIYSRERRRGTLTSYYRHTQTDDPYDRIGRQDITAQVDFSSLMHLGTGLGLGTEAFTTQRDFLNSLGLPRFMGKLRSAGLGQIEVDRNRMAMLDLVRPDGMGEFKVLVQGKKAGQPGLWGLEPDRELESLVDSLPVPLLTPGHMPLLEGRYPHLAHEWELGPTDEEAD